MKIQDLFKIKKIKSQDVKKSVEIDPFFYWKNILIIMFFVLLFVTIVSFVLYYLVNNEKFVDSKSRQEVQSLESVDLRIDKLNKLISIFNERDNVRNLIIESKEFLPDPSIRSSVGPKTIDTSVPVQKP